MVELTLEFKLAIVIRDVPIIHGSAQSYEILDNRSVVSGAGPSLLTMILTETGWLGFGIAGYFGLYIHATLVLIFENMPGYLSM